MHSRQGCCTAVTSPKLQPGSHLHVHEHIHVTSWKPSKRLSTFLRRAHQPLAIHLKDPQELAAPCIGFLHVHNGAALADGHRVRCLFSAVHEPDSVLRWRLWIRLCRRRRSWKCLDRRRGCGLGGLCCLPGWKSLDWWSSRSLLKRLRRRKRRWRCLCLPSWKSLDRWPRSDWRSLLARLCIGKR